MNLEGHKLGFDMDGVLANFNDAYADLLNKHAGTDLTPTYHTWDWDKACGFSSEVRSKAWKEISTTDFWFNLMPLDGALDALDRLGELAESNDVYFITVRNGKEAKQQTEDWLFGHGINHPTVLISSEDKTPIINGLKLDFYVDDKIDHIHRAHTNRLPQKFTQLYLVDRPYNSGYDQGGITRVQDVHKALTMFEETKNGK